MEKVGEAEEKTIEEESNSMEERSDKEDGRIRGTIADQVNLVDSTGEGTIDPSNSYTVDSNDPDFNSDMEDEEVLELFRRNSGLIPDQVAERNHFSYLNNSEGMVLQFQEDSSGETEQTTVMFINTLNDNNEIADLRAVNLNSLELLEGIKSSSASTEDTEDSSSNSDLDFSLSRYYFDGSLPVSSHVQVSETHQEDSPLPKDENQMPLLCPKQPTSWRDCCGLLQLLRAADHQ